MDQNQQDRPTLTAGGIMWMLFGGIIAVFVTQFINSEAAARLKTALLQWLPFLQIKKDGQITKSKKDNDLETTDPSVSAKLSPDRFTFHNVSERRNEKRESKLEDTSEANPDQDRRWDNAPEIREKERKTKLEDKIQDSLNAPSSKKLYPNRLLFRNVPDDVSENELKDFLKRLTGSKVIKLLFTEDDNGILVSFDREQDIASVQSKCDNPVNALKGKHLSVSEVPRCDSVLVENLNPNTSREILELFFDHEKNAGVFNGVRTLQLYPDHQKAVVKFNDFKVAEAVIALAKRKKLMLENYQLQISPFFQCLGLSGGRYFELPDAIDITTQDLDAYLKILFLKKCPVFCQKLKDYVLSQYAMPSFEGEDQLRLTCTLTPDIPKAHTIASKWQPRVKQVFQECMQCLDVHHLPIPVEDWAEMKVVIRDLRFMQTTIIEQSELLHLQNTQAEKHAIYVVGEKPFCSKIFEKIKEMQFTEEKFLALPHELRLLEASNFLSQECADVQLTIQNGTIFLKGTRVKVSKKNAKMQRLLKDIKTEKISNFSSAMLALSKKPQVAQKLQAMFQHENLVVVWEADNIDISVFSFKTHDARRAIQIIKDTVVGRYITLTDPLEALLKDKKWNKMYKKLKDEHGTFLSIYTPKAVTDPRNSPDRANAKNIYLVGIRDVVQKATREIEDFCDKNAVLTNTVFFPPGRHAFLVTVWMQRISDLSDTLIKERVKIKEDKNGWFFVLQGTHFGLEEAERRLRALEGSIVEVKKTFTLIVNRVMVRYLQSEEGRNDVQIVGKGNNCYVCFPNLPASNISNEPLTERTLEKRHGSRQILHEGQQTAFVREKNPPRLVRATMNKKPNSTSVKIEFGDIAEQQADVIVNTTESHLILSSGAVSTAILKKAGKDLQSECQMKYPTGIQDCSIAITTHHGLCCREIFHLALPYWTSRGSENLETMVTTCLTKASEKGFSSIVFPALGTGNKGYPRTETAQVMLATINDFFACNPNASLNDVRVVVYPQDTKVVQKFSAVFKSGTAFEDTASTLDKHARSRDGRTFTTPITLSTKIDSGKHSRLTRSPALLDSIDLLLYSESASNISKVLEDLERKAALVFPTVILEENLLTSKHQPEVKQICDICGDYSVDVKLDTQKRQIQLFGHVNDVRETQAQITAIFKKSVEIKSKREIEDYVASVVQWFFLEVTETGRHPKSYGNPENKIIEEAFKRKEQCARITDDEGNVYIIQFEQMVEYPENNEEDKVYVIRREKTEGDEGSVAFPDTWLPMRTDENLKIIALKSTEKEYTNVEEHFRRSLNRNVIILSIDRIQNKLLMRHYMSKRSHMASQKGSDLNEQILWHGTDSEATQNINQDGFNRSYCGKNATVLGKGVYFAVNSSYSAQSTYSPPDAAGKCYIYQCRVLTGHATSGHSSMMYLPKRTESSAYDSATDNKQNPSMYVIFSDTQAYPEYLITFNRKM